MKQINKKKEEITKNFKFLRIRDMKKLKRNIFNKFIISIIFLSAIATSIPISVCAAYGGQGEVQGGISGDINISLESIGFDDHRGMKAYINGREVFCIQRGYPFRSRVSELQMVQTSIDGNSGTIASLVRYLLTDMAGVDKNAGYFRGWGEYTINEDHTDAKQTSTDGAPSSLAWQEVFDEDMEDDEDSPFENRYQGTGDIGTVRRWLAEIKKLMTGHEGSLEPFSTQMKEITYEEAGFD